MHFSRKTFSLLISNYITGFALIVASQHLDSGVKTGKEVDEILFVKADGWKNVECQH